MLRSGMYKNTRLIRRVSLLLSFLLLIQLVPVMTRTASAASDGMIRVRLTRVGTPSSVSFRTTGSFNVAGQTVSSGTTVTVALSAGKLTMTAGTRTLASGSTISFNRNSTGSGCGVRFTSPSLANLYCGDLIFSVSGGGIQTVLRIYIETYLYGVVPFEMSNSYPIEALKAQAIAARTFAMRAKSTGGSYDVNDNANSQVFRGYTAAYSNAINAVDATRGVCLMSGGSYAQCMYTGSNGGQTESSKNAFGGAISYLTVKDDPYDLENPGSTLKKASIAKKGGGLSSALSKAILTAAASKLSSAGIKNASVVSVNSATLHSPRYDAPSRTYSKLRLNVTFSGGGKTKTLDVDLDTYNGLETTLGLSINSASNEIVSISETSDAFVLEFRRWGHGVGLSQRGAQWMAQKYGMGCSDILTFYYPGTKQSSFSFSDVLSSSSGSVQVTAPPTESQYGYTTIQEGSTGEAVKALQTKLKELGYFTGTPLGNYMTLTIAAVRAFQIDHDLTPDGIATPAVQKLIFEGAPASTATIAPTLAAEATQAPEPDGSDSEYQTLKYGNSGEAVKALQRRLMELGFFSGTIGGNYLTLTQTAVEDYQRANGLTVDGIATPELQEKLFNAIGVPPEATTAPTAAPTTTPTNEENTEQTAVVSLDEGGSRLNIRQNPTTASNVIGTLANGSSVTVTGSSGDWSAVRAAGVSGYVMTSYLRFAEITPTPSPSAESTATPQPSAEPTQAPEPSASPAPYNAVVALNNPSTKLNVRQNATTSSGVIGTLSHGDTVVVTGIAGEWSAIQTDRFSGYVMTQYLAAVASVPNAPTAATTTAPADAPAGSSAYGTLKYGDTGETVKALQRRLKELGYFTGNIGGNYLTLTQSAVEAYQRAYGLTVDGIASAQLQEKLFSSQPAAQITATPAPTATQAPVVTLAPTATAKPSFVETTAYVSLGSGLLNIRKSPSTSAQIIGRLAHGTAVLVTGVEGDWSAVSVDGVAGYVSSAYLSCDEPSKLPDSAVATVVPAAPTTAQTAQTTATPQPDVTLKPSASSEYRTLKPGDTGEAVKALQRKLKELGYFTGNIGGNYLTLTETAVRAYQKANGLKEDGIATAELQEELFETTVGSSAQTTSSSPNATIVVGAGTYLNMRASASASSKQLAKLYDGDRVNVLGEDGEWYKISYKGQTGYALKEFIRKDS